MNESFDSSCHSSRFLSLLDGIEMNINGIGMEGLCMRYCYKSIAIDCASSIKENHLKVI